MILSNRFRKSFVGMMSLSLIFSGAISVNAQEQTELNVSKNVGKQVTLSSVPLTVYNDGRVAGINSPENMSQQQKHDVLKLMRFTDEEIAAFPDDLENDLLKDGGIKIELNQYDYTHTYTDENGIDHIVTPENEAEVNLARQKAAGELALKSGGITPYGSVNEDIFTGTGVLTYLGETSTEFKYKYRTTFNWSSMPSLRFVDSIGQSWQNHTVSIGSTYDYDRYSNGYFEHKDRVELHQGNVYGTTADIDLDSHAGRHYGYIEDEVRIPLTYRNTTGQFASAYAHAWYPALIKDISLNIGNYVSITINGEGDKWSWKNTFKIGSTSLTS
jgi:hypothetical protein